MKKDSLLDPKVRSTLAMDLSDVVKSLLHLCHSGIAPIDYCEDPAQAPVLVTWRV